MKYTNYWPKKTLKYFIELLRNIKIAIMPKTELMHADIYIYSSNVA